MAGGRSRDEEVLDRSSVEGGTLRLEHDNALWDGRYMVFGDGSLMDRLTEVTVAAHELTHGVTEVEAQLIYQRQSGR